MPLALTMLAAVMLDWRVGEPRRLHPLVGFGRLATWLEVRLNPPPSQPGTRQRLLGLLAVLMLLTPATLLAGWLATLPVLGPLWAVVALYLAIGHRSLHDHARPVAAALQRGDMEAARNHAAMLVSRDKETLDPASATCESVLENGSDGVFGALFWFLVAGPAGAVLYRLANTLDAMWGYKTERFLHFGWAAARLDDALGYIPARLTALTYALLGHTRKALTCWRAQAPAWKSPNAGPVMAAGAGALGICLGGPARYHGEWRERPPLGTGHPAEAQDIEHALNLVSRGTVLWLILILLGAVLLEGIRHA
ncbi:MAG: adenosylcobinamide-phosphate synthase CbiB [Pseudomonadota bacterium]